MFAPHSTILSRTILLVLLLGLQSVAAAGQPTPATKGPREELQAQAQKARQLSRQGKLKEAIGVYEKLLPKYEQMHGKKSLETARVLHELAWLRHSLGENAAAEPLAWQALAVREAVLGKDDLELASTLNWLALITNDLGRHAEAESLARRALAIREARLAPDHVDIGYSLNNLALVLVRRARYALAEPLYVRALAIEEGRLGKDHLNVATTLANLADLYRRLGRYAEAEPLARRALAIREDRRGKEHAEVASSLSLLGRILVAEARYGEAEPVYKRALALLEARFGKDQPRTTNALADLADLYRLLCRYAEAEGLARRALAIREAQLGKEHHELPFYLNVLALVYFEQGHYAKAEPLYRRALAIADTHSGDEHPDLPAFLNNLALLDVTLARYTEAESLYRRARTILEASLGRDHPRVALFLTNLANLKSDLGLYAEAEPLYRRALEIRETRLGNGHPDVAAGLNSVALLYWRLGRYSEAEPLARRALAINEACFGTDHLRGTHAMNTLALLERAQGRFASAQELQQRCLEIAEAQLGGDHPNVATYLSNLANVYADLGRYHAAEPLYRRAVALQEDRFGTGSVKVTLFQTNLANLYRHLARYAEAEPLLREALALREAKLGKDHPDVASGLYMLGRLYAERGPAARAEPLYLQALALREARLGKDHPDVAGILNSLGNLELSQGHYRQAEAFYRRSLVIEQDRLGPEHPSVGIALQNLAGLALTRDGSSMSADQFRALQHDLERSQHILAKAHGELHNEVANVLRLRARACRAQGDLEHADTLFQQALEIYQARFGRDHPRTVNTLAELASLHAARGRHEEAIRLTDRALRGLRRHTVTVLPMLTEAEQLVFLKRSHTEQLDKALSLVLGRSSSAEECYRAAEWLLNGKAVAQQALAERLLLARDNRSPEARQLLAELGDVRRELSRLTLSNEADRTRRHALAEQEKELSARLYPSDEPRRRDDPWVELDDLRHKLQSGTIYVDIARLGFYDCRAKTAKEAWQPARYAAWLTPHEGAVAVVDLGPAEPIDRAVQSAREALEKSRRQLAREGERSAEQAALPSLQALARRVLTPLRVHLDRHPRWVLSPDGLLWLIPWAALPLDEQYYVIEKHCVTYAVCGRDLVLNPLRLDFKSGPPLIFADPDFDLDAASGSEIKQPRTEVPELRGLSHGLPARVARLPGTAAEAEAVAPYLKKYARMEPQLRVDRQARASALLAAHGPKVLLLATHGYFLPEQELAPGLRHGSGGFVEEGAAAGLEDPLLRCGLLLAGCNHAREAAAGSDNGVVTGRVIISTDLRGTELVVLSACDTGLGEVRNGEGIAGLRQAFQLAGAEAVVATLWSIPDQPSAQLMEAFFDNLATGQGRAEALRGAQLELIRQHRQRSGAAHPFFWAAYTVTGRDR
jgi:tetratricopeptide (TPR) repeat protein